MKFTPSFKRERTWERPRGVMKFALPSREVEWLLWDTNTMGHRFYVAIRASDEVDRKRVNPPLRDYTARKLKEARRSIRAKRTREIKGLLR